MYALVLVIHSWLRWLVLALGVALLAVSWTRWRGPEGAAEGLGRLERTFLWVLGGQVAAGLLLYGWLSPTVSVARSDMRSALEISPLRFYSIEHPFGMLVGVLVAFVGVRRARRREGRSRARATFLALAVWLFVTLVSIPWPGLPYGRPLVRWGP